MKKCNICNIEKLLVEFNIDRTKKDGYMNFCKSCRYDKYLLKRDTEINRSKKYRIDNIERVTEYEKRYRKDNKEKLKAIWKEYRIKNRYKMSKAKLEYCRKRRKIDPLYKLIGNIRSLILKSIKYQGFSKKSKTCEILGCSFEEFRNYLESKFENGMSWENQGKWHLDHIRPISSATDESEVFKLNHYTNFQPLWGFDNISKSNKYNPIILDNNSQSI